MTGVFLLSGNTQNVVLDEVTVSDNETVIDYISHIKLTRGPIVLISDGYCQF